jgi:hypothetical protein
MNYEIGKHPARAVNAVLGVANTGTEQVGIEYEFTDGPNKGKRITHYAYFTDKTMDRSVETLRLSGFEGDDLTDVSSLSAPTTPVVQLVLEHEEHNGVSQIRVKWVNRLGGAAVKQAMEPDQARDFANRMRGHLVAYDRQQGGASTAAPKAKKPTVNGRGPSGDGLPF